MLWIKLLKLLLGAQNAGANEFYGLGKFQKNNPPTFKGSYDLEGAQIWI